MYQLRDSGISPEWAPACWVRRMGKPLLILPYDSTTLKKFQNDLKDFQTSKGTLRFTPDRPLPASFVKKLVQARIAENRG
jgi:uncharacterized protein YdhG (YjbR/CyaY superfamily)